MFVKKLLEKIKLKISYIGLIFFFDLFRKKTKPKNVFLNYRKSEIRNIFKKLHGKKTLFLQTQIGRGGGKWLIDILNTINSVSAYGERNPNPEAFFRYSRSHGLKNYDNQLLDLVKSEIISDWQNHQTSYVSSPYFSHGIDFLDKKLNPKKIVILLTSAKRLLTSLKNKGWYNKSSKIDISKFYSKPLNIKYKNHFYGRMLNLGIENSKFNSLSQVGKIAFFMSKTLEKIYHQLLNIDRDKILIFRLDEADQNYDYCKNFISKLGLKLIINKKNFLKLKKRSSAYYENKSLNLSPKEINELKVNLKKFKYYEKKIISQFESNHTF